MKALACSVMVSLLSLTAAAVLAGEIKAFHAGRPEKAVEPTQKALVQTDEMDALVAQGKLLYGAGCSHCHGADALGDEGPNLHALSLSDARIATTIRKGIKGEMPSFEKKYSPEEVAALVKYVRSLE